MRRTPTAGESKTMNRVPSVSDIMRRDFVFVSPETSIHDAAKKLLKREVAGAAVIDNNEHFLGFLSTHGLMLAVVDFLNEEIPVGPVRSYLDAEPPALNESSSLMVAVDAFTKLSRTNVALPVLRGERLVGVVTPLDVVRAAMSFLTGEKDTTPGTLYLSALKSMDEKPRFDDDRESSRRKTDES